MGCIYIATNRISPTIQLLAGLGGLCFVVVVGSSHAAGFPFSPGGVA